jgi:phage gpG-like protein
MIKRLIGTDALAADLEHLTRVVSQESLAQLLASQVRAQLLAGIAQNFSSASSPRNRRWPKRKTGGDWPLLIKSGALRAAATGAGAGAISRATDRTLEVGVDMSVRLGGIPGAAAHNFGYPPRNLAQREFLGPRKENLEAIDELVIDYLLERM